MCWTRNDSVVQAWNMQTCQTASCKRACDFLSKRCCFRNVECLLNVNAVMSFLLKMLDVWDSESNDTLFVFIGLQRGGSGGISFWSRLLAKKANGGEPWEILVEYQFLLTTQEDMSVICLSKGWEPLDWASPHFLGKEECSVSFLETELLKPQTHCLFLFLQQCRLKQWQLWRMWIRLGELQRSIQDLCQSTATTWKRWLIETMLPQ